MDNGKGKEMFSRLRIAAVFAVLSSFLLVSPASAEDYRYWSFYVAKDNAWTFATTGPADNPLADRDVNGWQFGIFGDNGGATPAQAPSFADLCPTLESAGAAEGQLRVAVVIDAGTPQEAPAGETPIEDRVECVLLPAGANSFQALAKAAEIREDNGMVCGIDGYPATECAAVVSSSASPTPSTEVTATAAEDAQQSSLMSPGLWLAMGVIALGLLIVLISSRRRNR